MERHDEAQKVLETADCLHDAAAVSTAYDRMAAAISAEYAGKNPLILCVMIGGLHATSEITRRLKFPFEIDYLHASRYRGETTGGGLVWKASPTTSLHNRHVLVIDDILDEGYTLAAIVEALNKQDTASLKVAVLAEKIHERKAKGIKADYVGLTVVDRYVFGCGMDYKEYWRQLPAIYAVKGM